VRYKCDTISEESTASFFKVEDANFCPIKRQV